MKSFVNRENLDDLQVWLVQIKDFIKKSEANVEFVDMFFNTYKVDTGEDIPDTYKKMNDNLKVMNEICTDQNEVLNTLFEQIEYLNSLLDPKKSGDLN